MKCYCLIITLTLLVIRADSLSKWARLRTPKRYYADRPVWGPGSAGGSNTQNYYTAFNEEGRPVWGSGSAGGSAGRSAGGSVIKNSYANFDQAGRPIWGSAEGSTESSTEGSAMQSTPKTTTLEQWELLPAITEKDFFTATEKYINDPTIFEIDHQNIMLPHDDTGGDKVDGDDHNDNSDDKNDDGDVESADDDYLDEQGPYRCEIGPPKDVKYIKTPGKRMALQKCDEYKQEMKNNLQLERYNTQCNIGSPNMVLQGRPVRNGEYPHMGALGWASDSFTYVFKCGGSLISNNFVLTAAHCTLDSSDTNLIDRRPVVVRLVNDRVNVPITDILKHKEHKGKYNDIALLKLENFLFDVNVRPACLWHRFDIATFSTTANVTGWGKTESAVRSSDLLVAEIDIIDSEICSDRLKYNFNRHFNGIRDTQLCAGKLSGGADTCQGDSGGPLQIEKKKRDLTMYYIVGVTSFGIRCGTPGLPGVYTRVSSYLDWIESCVWDDIDSETCKKYSIRM